MEKVIPLENYRELKRNESNSLTKLDRSCSMKVLTPVTLSGVIVPWSEKITDSRELEYKLVCEAGQEYFFIANPYWKSVLSWHSWDEVKVKGLLNSANMTIVPQKIYPKGPTVENENVIDLAASRAKKVFKKIGRNINDLVIIPAGLLAMMMAL